MSKLEVEWSLKLRGNPDLAVTSAGGEKGLGQQVVCGVDTEDTRGWMAENVAAVIYLVMCRDYGIKPEEILHIPVKMLEKC